MTAVKVGDFVRTYVTMYGISGEPDLVDKPSHFGAIKRVSRLEDNEIWLQDLDAKGTSQFYLSGPVDPVARGEGGRWSTRIEVIRGFERLLAFARWKYAVRSSREIA